MILSLSRKAFNILSTKQVRKNRAL